ncbi:MAG: capsule assembly Wzi family protein, partial [Candidatus Ratteibacteria bacterium]
MKKHWLFFFILSFAIQSNFLNGQIISVERENIQDFLSKMEIKGFFRENYFSNVLTIDEIVKKLNILNENRLILNSFEKEQLDYYLQAYQKFVFSEKESSKEFKFLNGLYKERMDLFYYSQKDFKMVINPAITIDAENLMKHNQYRVGWGLNSFARMNNGFEFSFSFMDNSVYNGDYWNKLNFTDEQGRIITRFVKNKNEFSDTRGSIFYKNDWLLLSLLKDDIKLGNGEASSLILSNKSPSFPSFYLRLNPTDWLTIYSMHSWLLSGIVDSTKSYWTNYNFRDVSHEKYFAMHAVTIQPFQFFNLTFGETIIYSDRGPYLGYFIPFLFYRSVDHTFTYGGGDSGNNGSFFVDGNVYLFDKIKLYGSFYIDEFSFSGIIKGKSDRNQSAYTVGVKSFDIPVLKSSFVIEYTKILPWVYSNWIPAQTYTNLNNPLGHYIGQNSDQIFFKFKYNFTPYCNLLLKSEYTRNGG